VAIVAIGRLNDAAFAFELSLLFPFRPQERQSKPTTALDTEWTIFR